MNNIFHIMGVVILTAASTGCSSIIHEKFSVDGTPAQSLSIDARQRVILVTNKGGKHGSEVHKFHVVCAEPSPDMFSTIASSLGANAAVAEKSVGISSSLVEGAVKMGPRTQTIQLLRDGLYRACEGYMNGILDWREYKAIVSSYDIVMMTTLAIDGLSSAQDMTAAISGGSASANSGDASSSTTGGTATTTHLQSSVSNKNAEIIRGILNDYYKFKLDYIKERNKTSR